MIPQVNIYYIPSNPYILKGSIYTLYINNNNNLDLSSIIQYEQNKDNYIISKQDYAKLLELNNQSSQLTNNQTTIIQNFLNEEKKTISELIKINTEKQNLIKKLIKREE